MPSSDVTLKRYAIALLVHASLNYDMLKQVSGEDRKYLAEDGLEAGSDYYKEG